MAVAAAAAVLAALAVGVRVVAAAVEASLQVLLGQPLALDVRLDPEVGEEDEEESAVHPDEVDDQGELVVAGVHEVVLGGVEGDQHKLDLWHRNDKKHSRENPRKKEIKVKRFFFF